MVDSNRQWKNRHRSFYYMDTDIPDPQVDMSRTALLIIDIQNAYLAEFGCDNPNSAANQEWIKFRERLANEVIPNAGKMLQYFRALSLPVFFARIACLTTDGRDRSLSQRRPGFNNVVLPLASRDSQIVAELEPMPGEVVLTKTTDSAVTGTSISLIMRNMGIHHVVVCGIFTDQCVSSTVRSLADESFDVVLIEDACTAATEKLHFHELEIINNIYCQVMYSDEFITLMKSIDP